MMFLKSWRESTDLLTWRKALSCWSFCCLPMCFSWYLHLRQFYSGLLCSSGFLQSYLRVQDYRQNVSSFPEVVAICLLGMTSNHYLLLLAWKRQRRNQSHPSFVWTSYPRLNTCVRRDGSHRASAASRVLPIHCSCEAECHGNMLCDSSSLREPTPTPEARIHDFLQNWPPPKGPISKDRGGGSWDFKLRLSWWCFMDHKLGNCARLDDMSFFIYCI